MWVPKKMYINDTLADAERLECLIFEPNPGSDFNKLLRPLDARNFVAHGYDKVDDVILWGIVINDLPRLKEEVHKLL